MAEISEMLAALGYTGQWLAYEVLSPEDLAAQYAAFSGGEDPNTEHYRYGTYRRYLLARQKLTDDELTKYLRLLALDPDQPMADAATTDLFRLVALTPEQFEKTCALIATLEGRLFHLVVRERLLRKLNGPAISEELFAECLRDGDRLVQECVIGLASETQLQQLATLGLTKRVRRLALEKLRSHSH